MVNKNLKTIIENKKPFETVYELKNEYEIPSFEEFMKTYEYDANLNYADLNGGDISETKGYGPCTDGRPMNECHCTKEELFRQLNLKFYLKISYEYIPFLFEGKHFSELKNIKDARRFANDLRDEFGFWDVASMTFVDVSSACSNGSIPYATRKKAREITRKEVLRAIRKYEGGHEINGEIRVEVKDNVLFNDTNVIANY